PRRHRHDGGRAAGRGRARHRAARRQDRDRPRCARRQARDARLAEAGADTADAFLKDMARRGAMHFIYTDISRDGMLAHPDFLELRRVHGVLNETGEPATLIYSGGVTSVEDVVGLNEYDLEGAIVGTALYDGRLDF